MQRVVKIALASATLCLVSSPAGAQTVTQGQGPNFLTHITASTSNTQNNNAQVFGSTTGVGGSDVLFTGNTQISITDGNGFASISDSTIATNTGIFTSLIINPAPLFTALQFNLSLDTRSFLQVDFSYGGNIFANAGILSQNANANTGYIISGGPTPFDAIRLTSCSSNAICNTAVGVGFGTGSAINFERQNSIQLSAVGAVPEPGTWAMMLVGFGGIGYSIRRRRKMGTIAQLV